VHRVEPRAHRSRAARERPGRAGHPAPAGHARGAGPAERVVLATLEEWEDFESGYQCDEEEWLAAHAGHPEAARIAEQVDEHRSFWLRGYRGLLGQAYLTLVPVA
jgi:hypothetical protein